MLDIFSAYFDKRCVACGGAVSWRGGSCLLCPACLAALSSGGAGTCTLCGLPFAPGSQSSGPCHRCILHKPVWSDFMCIGPYEGTLRRLVLALKFSSALYAANILGSLISAKLKSGDFGSFDCIAAVPLHPKRLQERGYNQSLEIAVQISRELKVPVNIEGLVRIRHCPPQESLGEEERRKAVKGAFAAQASFAEMRVLLVDDVMTTGASVEACCRELLGAGAEQVAIAVAARTHRN